MFSFFLALQASPTGAAGGINTDSNGVFDASSGAISFSLTTGPPGTTDNSIDFGLFESFGIGDYVWSDVNFDGLQDANDVPLEGIVVGLYAAGSTTSPLATTATSASGLYRFSSRDLPNVLRAQTTYTVAVALGQRALDGFVVTKQNVASDDAADNDASVSGAFAVIAARTPTYGEYDWTFDVSRSLVCLLRVCSISDSGSSLASSFKVALATMCGMTTMATVCKTPASVALEAWKFNCAMRTTIVLLERKRD